MKTFKDLLLVIAFIAVCFLLLWWLAGDVNLPDPLRSIWNDLAGSL
jgi:hypothetical protein